MEANLLDKYLAAGVKSFTVRNNEAIAVNPYERFFGTAYTEIKEWTQVNSLSPLPAFPMGR